MNIKVLALNACQKRTYDFMKKNHGITTLQANKELEETRLSARIYELRSKGIVVFDEWLKVKNRYGDVCRVKKYFLSRMALR